MRNKNKITNLKIVKNPEAFLSPSSTSKRGIPASRVPTGQRSLQNHGDKTLISTKKNGKTNTNKTSVIYFINLKTLGIL